MNSIHQFSVKKADGTIVSLKEFHGKVLLIVNTASKCGFTPQLDNLTKLYKEYKDKGLEILAFPSNDFANQEPLDGTAIQEFCVLNYNADYPIFDKIHVKGNKTHELYQFLSDKTKNGKVSSSPKWNFHKYLVNKKGEVVDYYYSTTNPEAKRVKKAIERLINE